jgi:mannosyltransferase
VGVHAAFVLAVRRWGDVRARLVPFGVAWASALVMAAPIVVAAALQRDQLAFRRERDEMTPESVTIDPWFTLAPLALVAWSLIAVAVVAAVAHRRDAAWRGRRELLLLAAAWMLLPTLVLLATTALVTPVYTPRYLVVAAPGVAIAMAVGVTALRWTWLRILAIAIVAALAVPAYVDERGPYANNGGTDWQDVAAVVGRWAEPGDGIAFDESVRPSRRPRLAMHGYPDPFTGVVDLGLVRPYDRTDALWDVTTSLAAVPHRLRGIDRVLVVTRSRHGVDDDLATLRSAGFVETGRVELESDVVIRLERRT